MRTNLARADLNPLISRSGQFFNIISVSENAKRPFSLTQGLNCWEIWIFYLSAMVPVIFLTGLNWSMWHRYIRLLNLEDTVKTRVQANEPMPTWTNMGWRMRLIFHENGVGDLILSSRKTNICRILSTFTQAYNLKLTKQLLNFKMPNI